MWWMVSRIMCSLAIATYLSGCAAWSKRHKLPVLPPTEAPRIIMNSISSTQIFPVSSLSQAPTIEILDHRPGPERYYYPGSLEPRRWQDGLSMVPMEAFDPSIEDQIRARCVRSLDGTDIRSVSIALTSFQFVFDQRLKLKGESSDYIRNWLAQKDDEREERRERRRLADERSKQMERQRRDLKRNLGMDVDEPSFADGLFSDAATGAFRWLVFDKPRKNAESAEARQLRTPLPAETPDFISNGKREGLNCQLKAVVTVTFADGQTQELNAETAQHAPFDASQISASQDLQTQIGDLVTRTVDDFASSIMN